MHRGKEYHLKYRTLKTPESYEYYEYELIWSETFWLEDRKKNIGNSFLKNEMEIYAFHKN